MLLSKPQKMTTKEPVKGASSKGTKMSKTVFFTGIQDNTMAKDLCKNVGKVKDIILPRKRDMNSNRFGFISTFKEEEAQNLINSLGGYKFGDKKLYLSFEKTGTLNRNHTSSSIPITP